MILLPSQAVQADRVEPITKSHVHQLQNETGVFKPAHSAANKRGTGCRLRSEQIYSKTNSRRFWRLYGDVVTSALDVRLALALLAQHQALGSPAAVQKLVTTDLARKLAVLNNLYGVVAPSQRSRNCKELVYREIARDAAAYILELNREARLLLATGSTVPIPEVGAPTISESEASARAAAARKFGNRYEIIWLDFEPEIKLEGGQTATVVFSFWLRATEKTIKDVDGYGCPYYVEDRGVLCIGPKR